jgi:hypothetical protein
MPVNSEQDCCWLAREVGMQWETGFDLLCVAGVEANFVCPDGVWRRKPVADIFDMQDEVVARLANQLGTELISSEPSGDLWGICILLFHCADDLTRYSITLIVRSRLTGLLEVWSAFTHTLQPEVCSDLAGKFYSGADFNWPALASMVAGRPWRRSRA